MIIDIQIDIIDIDIDIANWQTHPYYRDLEKSLVIQYLCLGTRRGHCWLGSGTPNAYSTMLHLPSGFGTERDRI